MQVKYLFDKLPKAFAADCPCFVKKGSIPAVITGATGSKQWKVVALDDDGNKSSNTEKVYKSQQLRRVRKDQHHPLILSQNDSPDISIDSSSSEAIEVTVTMQQTESQQGSTTTSTGSETASISSNGCTSPSLLRKESSMLGDISFEAGESCGGEEVELEVPQPEGTSEHEEEVQEAEVDPDLVLDEDFALAAEDHVNEDGENVNLLAMGQAVESNDDKYKKKWDNYTIERKAWVDAKHTIKCKPPSQQGLDIGARVEERRGDKRKGLIIASDKNESEKDAPPCWEVLFDETTGLQHNIPSTALKLIKDKRIFEWTAVGNSFPDRPVRQFRRHGIVGFDFQAFDNARLSVDNKDYDFPFLRLLVHLWPGNWREQLCNLNLRIDDVNQTLSRPKRILNVSEFEWWAFWGCIFAACPAGVAGEVLFQENKLRKLVQSLNLGPGGLGVMSWTRFKAIRQNISFAFYDTTNPDDPYHPVKLLVDGFNDSRKKKIAMAIKIVLDESMSPFQPRTSKTSRLPNISFIFRKPKPLGVENKNAGCSKTRTLLFQEIQRGKSAMRKEKFYAEVGATTACTLRLILGSTYCGQNDEERQIALQQERRYLIVADSWFGSVKLAESMKLLYRQPKISDGSGRKWEYTLRKDCGCNPNGHELIASVKTNSSWFPKKEIESKMKAWPSGSYLVLSCTAPETKVELVALGYKYNARKVLCFIMTKNAGITKPGASAYIARFPDKHGNLKERRVQRPEILSEYFAIDAFRGIQFAKPDFDQTVVAYADSLAWDCVHNPYSKAKTANNSYVPVSGDALSSFVQSIVVENFRERTIEVVNSLVEQFEVLSVQEQGRPSFESALTVDSAIRDSYNVIDIGEHDPVAIPQKSKNDSKRSAKRKCVICKKDSRVMCGNGICKTREVNHKGSQCFGTPICNPTAGPRMLEAYGGAANTRTCLQIHRDRIRSAKHREYKDRVSRRATAEAR